MQCATCRFWVRLKDGQGECRRYPPATMSALSYAPHGAVDQRLTAQWNRAFTFPVLTSDAWCGEHVPRLAAVR